jgi:uncharacterized protein YdaU (DUF1376 family)
MGESPFIKFYPSDFLAGTSGLSPAERGVYITLLCLIYEADGPIERHDARLSRRCGSLKAAFQRTLEALINEGKIVEADGMLSNRRAEKAIVDRQNRSQIGTYAAHQRWTAQSDKTQQNQGRDDASALAEQCTSDASQKPEPDITETKVSVAQPSKRRSSKHPLPEGWVPDLGKASAMMAEMELTRDEMNYCYQQMKGHAHATDRRLANWDQGFANWVRKAVQDGDVGSLSRARRQRVTASAFDF